MFRYILGGGSFQTYLIAMLLSLPIVLLSLSFHEAAHGFVADKLGDPTAKNLGRVTLNPLKHLNLLGFISMLLVGFGWANPVPINSRNFRHPRRDLVLSSLAGPVSNLLLAVIFLLLLRFVGYGWLWQKNYASEMGMRVAELFILFFYYGISMNLTLAVFNLVPIPPLDGSRLLTILLPPRVNFKIMQYQRYITLAVILLLWLGPLSWLIQWVTSAAMRGLFTMAGMSGFLI